ncbi:hypothetical protein ACTJKN_25760 [Pedobacter sp. 22163]|uniref:hypothetical protein n=1 Tax=Pedobacter sp. 22163 TaxID=3453883 RepID=UPI003F87C458
MGSYNGNAVASVLEGLDWTLSNAFLAAYKNKNESVWKELVEFTSTELLLAFTSKSIPLARHLALLPARFLYGCLEQEYGAESVIRSFGNTFEFSQSFFSGNVESEQDEKAVMNKLLYDSIAQFFFQALRLNNDENLFLSFKSYNKLRERGYDFGSEFKIAKYQGASDEKLAILRRKSELEGFRPLLHRRLSLSLHSWVIFLLSIDKIEGSRAAKVLSGIHLRYDSTPQILNDAIYIRKFSYNGYLGVQWWDYMARPSGESYTPPSAYEWITLGATYHLLNSPLLDVDLSDIPESNDYIFLLETVKRNLASFEKDWNKWSSVFNVGPTITNDETKERSLENFKSQSRVLLSILARLKNRQQSAEDKAVAEEKLSNEKITDFKNAAFAEWKRNNRILNFFDHFGNVQKNKQIEKLPAIGTSLYLQGFKVMFLNENFKEIYGSAQIGGEVARSVDGRFIREIMMGSNIDDTRHETLNEGLKLSIKSLVDEGYSPNLIIVPPEFIYRTDLYALEGFTRSEGNENDLADFGSYEGIPITTFYTPLLNEEVFVLDFRSSVKLEIYEDNERINNRLLMEVREMTSEEMETKFEQEAAAMRSGEEGSELTDGEIKLKIASSLYLDIWINAKFSVVEQKAIKRFTINNLGAI